jgi:hypothetical protein
MDLVISASQMDSDLAHTQIPQAERGSGLDANFSTNCIRRTIGIFSMLMFTPLEPFLYLHHKDGRINLAIKNPHP